MEDTNCRKSSAKMSGKVNENALPHQGDRILDITYVDQKKYVVFLLTFKWW